MANRKEMSKLYFSKKIRKREKVYLQINQLLVIKLQDVCDVYVQSTVQENITEAPDLNCAHEKLKATCNARL